MTFRRMFRASARCALSFALSAAVALPALAQAPCPAKAAFTAPDGGVTREVRELNGALIFGGGLRLNTDGAANSYHPFGTEKGALNTICNAIGVTPGPGQPHAGEYITALNPTTITGKERCAIIRQHAAATRDAGWKILPEAKINWYAIAAKPTADNYGVCVQKEGDPFPGFFVSMTARPSGARPDDVCSPGHWIDSTSIPYITLPSRSADFKERKADVGQLALVHRKVGGADTFVVAVVADRGNAKELGEGSVALHRALGGDGKTTLPEGITTYLFPNKAAPAEITADTLGAQRAALMEALGGEAAALACAAGK